MPLVYLVAGARPNFMKIAPLYRRLRATGVLDVQIVHTGQHYDRAMSAVFFEQLGLPEPHVNLEVGSGSHGAQTARVLERFEAALQAHQPAAVVVVGDVNSTIACALAAAKMVYADGTRPLVAHVEAGLRSGDRSMPEETNRVLTDAIADLLFTTEPSADANLRREGVDPRRIRFVGNVMIDCLVDAKPRIDAQRQWERFGLARGEYGIVTLHRPANVDSDSALMSIVEALWRVGDRVPLVFPVHPRTRARLEALGAGSARALQLTEPLGYLEFMSLLSGSRIVLTDSGGVQEEATFLRVPCLTLRDNTERPVTITQGTNTLVGSRPVDLEAEARRVLDAHSAPPPLPLLWDGRAAERIAAELAAQLTGAADAAPAGTIALGV